ncbi:MAG: DUF3048 domain-containing protein, partial [Actinobacteria bacterium]|nr:DUF3048 domain-containing protein [Actinomycetota bacterium]
MYAHSRSRSARPPLGVAVALLGLALVACSGNDTTANAPTTATTPGTVALSIVTSPPIPTTMVPPTTEAPATTTTEVAPPVYPLTGLPVTDPAIAARPTLVVKIDNAPGARPQTGFNEADLVFEEIVNDRLTRFAMVFQSQDSDPVGPIRSGRIQDINLFGSFNHPLFAWSGGNKTVTAAVDASDLVNLSQLRVPVYFRTTDKSVPH